MSSVQGSAFLYGIMDGDVITGALRSTKALVQYIRKDTNSYIPNFTQAANQPTIYPHLESQVEQRRLAPVAGTEKWYYNNDSTAITFGSDNISTAPSAAAGKFKKTTFNNGDFVVPALQVIGNLASPSNTDSDTISLTCDVESGGHVQTVRSSIFVRVEEVEGDPYIAFIDATDGGVIDSNTPTVTLTATLLKAGGEVTSGLTYKWFKSSGSTWAQIPGTAKTLTLGADSIDSRALIKCEITHSGITTNAVIEVSDETDPSVMVFDADGSTTLTSKEPTNKVTITPKVVKRGTGAIDTRFNGKPYSFLFLNAKGQAISLKTAPTNSSFTVTFEDIKAAFFNIRYHATVTA